MTSKGAEHYTKIIVQHFAYENAGFSQYRAGDFAGAESSLAKAVELRREMGVADISDRRELNQFLTWWRWRRPARATPPRPRQPSRRS
jgi:hypothetical protein